MELAGAGERAQHVRHVGQIAELEAHIAGMARGGRPDVGMVERMHDRAVAAGALAEHAAPPVAAAAESPLDGGSISVIRKSAQAPVDAELTYWLPPIRVKQSGNATTTGGMRRSPISRSSRSGTFSRKPPVGVRRPAGGEPDQVDQQRQSLSVMSRRDVDVDGARRRIAEHVVLEGLALDGDAADGTRRPEKLAHLCPRLLRLVVNWPSLPRWVCRALAVVETGRATA